MIYENSKNMLNKALIPKINNAFYYYIIIYNIN
jgi:hypothetical protein